MEVTRRIVKSGQTVRTFADFVVWDNEGFDTTVTIALNGVGQNLVNVTAVAWTLALLGTATPVATWTLGSEITVTAGSGLITVTVTQAAIAAIALAQYEWDLVVTGWPIATKPANIARGRFEIAAGQGA